MLPPFSKSKKTMNNILTEKKIKSELGLIFSGILKDNNKESRRQFNVIRMNILRQLETKPVVKRKTKRILKEFNSFLNEFEK